MPDCKLNVVQPAEPCRHAGLPRKPCEFLSVVQGEFVWNRRVARSRFEGHLERESSKGIASNETPLDGIWRAAEATISDVVAHVPVRRVVPQVEAPINATDMLEWAIAAACKELGFQRGHFGNKRGSVQAIGFAYALLHVHVSREVAAKMLGRSKERLRQARKRLTENQAARAVELAGRLKVKWTANQGTNQR